MSEPPLVRCPQCGKDTLAKVMGTGSGLIFKGSGFYLTDYKNTSGSPAKSDTPKTDKTDKGEKPSKPESGATDTKKENKPSGTPGA
jgi:predicted nucleic acid-binding Zn ribbon protein